MNPRKWRLKSTKGEEKKKEGKKKAKKPNRINTYMELLVKLRFTSEN